MEISWKWINWHISLPSWVLLKFEFSFHFKILEFCSGSQGLLCIVPSKKGRACFHVSDLLLRRQCTVLQWVESFAKSEKVYKSGKKQYKLFYIIYDFKCAHGPAPQSYKFPSFVVFFSNWSSGHCAMNTSRGCRGSLCFHLHRPRKSSWRQLQLWTPIITERNYSSSTRKPQLWKRC